MTNKRKPETDQPEPPRLYYSNIPCSRPTRDAIKAEARAQGKWLYFYCEEILKRHLESGKTAQDDKKI